jgi:hypothetical protein
VVSREILLVSAFTPMLMFGAALLLLGNTIAESE